VWQRRLWNHTAPHLDVAVDQFGNQVVALTDMGKIRTYRLDGVGGQTTYTTISGGHVSGRAYNRPGWVYVSDSGRANAGAQNNYGMYREVYAVKLDEKPGGVVTVNRYTKHYNNEDEGYRHQTQAVPNRDGTKVMFASNMNDTATENQNYPFSWVVELDN
jgi:hypothetical protein